MKAGSRIIEAHSLLKLIRFSWSASVGINVNVDGEVVSEVRGLNSLTMSAGVLLVILKVFPGPRRGSHTHTHTEIFPLFVSLVETASCGKKGVVVVVYPRGLALSLHRGSRDVLRRFFLSIAQPLIGECKCS